MWDRKMNNVYENSADSKYMENSEIQFPCYFFVNGNTRILK